MSSAENNNVLERQYQLAIDARYKLNDNFHKWMTYYYVANGAILVAVTSLHNNSSSKGVGILALSIIGIFICILWNLSCKGYYYWSKSWMKIIIDLEKRLTKEDVKFGVYSIFAKEVADNEDSPWILNKPANISTPKLTLIFSFFSIMGWIFFGAWQFWIQTHDLPIFTKIIILVIGLFIILAVYGIFLPAFSKSRDHTSHILI